MEWLQRLRRPSNINLWKAGRAQIEAGKIRSNEFFKELQDLFTGRRDGVSDVGTTKREKGFRVRVDDAPEGQQRRSLEFLEASD